MRYIFTLVILSCISFASKSQDCSSLYMQGYHGDTTININEASRLILTSFTAINNCGTKVKMKSGSFFLFTPEGLIGTGENFLSTLDDETKLRLISRLKPGYKIVLENLVYGDENKLVPSLSIMLVK